MPLLCGICQREIRGTERIDDHNKNLMRKALNLCIYCGDCAEWLWEGANQDDIEHYLREYLKLTEEELSRALG